MTASRIKLAAAGAALMGAALAQSSPAAEASPSASHGSHMSWRQGTYPGPTNRPFDGFRRGRRSRDGFGGLGFGDYGWGDYGSGDYGFPPAVGAPQGAPLFVSIVSAPNFYAPPLPFDALPPPPGPEIVQLRPPRPWRGKRPIVVYGVHP